MLIAIKHHAKLKNLEDLEACAVYEQWFKEKVDSTFNTLCTFQKYASTLARLEPGLLNIVWMDSTNYKTMRFQGHTVEFDKLTTLFSNVESHAVALWEEQVLMNLSIHVEYGQITDDLTNSEVGYSLFSDKRNKCFLD